ncbi:MAG TPA: hypothetical protein PKB04_08110, partial [Phenylobacterium sp.]|nr:hypothetical protein [Phenylobacterium sp.]
LVNVGLGRLERGAPGPAIDALREGARRLSLLGRRRDAARARYNLANAAALVGDDALARGAGMSVVGRIPPARKMFMQQAGGALGDLPRLLRGEAL